MTLFKMKMLPKIFENTNLNFKSLTFFRVCLGFFILFNLLQRSEFLAAHYSDQGVLPRADLLPIVDPWGISIHFMSGEAWVQMIIFGIHAIFALLFLFGIRPNFSAFACWFLELSLQHRNPMLLDASDSILSLVLLWSIFLPLDRKRGSPKEGKTNNWGTFGLVLQVCSIYFFSAVLKIQSGNWLELKEAGGILYGIKTSLPHWIKYIPKQILSLAAIFTLVVELIGPLVYIFSKNYRTKNTVVIVFLAFHLCVAATLGIWRFSILCMIIWAALFLQPNTSYETQKTNAPKNYLAISLILISFATNLFSIGLVPHTIIRILHPALSVLGLHQNWNMFTNPTMFDKSTFEITADSDEGSAKITLPGSRWLNYTNSLKFTEGTVFLERMAKHVCETLELKKKHNARIRFSTSTKSFACAP